MSKTILTGTTLALGSLLLFACAQGSKERRSPATASLLASELVEAQAAFELVYDVLQHPRCLNCHPAGDRPLQYDAGRAHSMNVVRGPDDRGVPGMRCDGCHGTSNAPLPHMPPGVSSGWRLAPREMVFEGRSRAELALQLMDPKLSHMDGEQLLEHVAHDPLVQWGWNPGPGRDPVPVPHEDFVDAFRTWLDAGAPTPTEEARR